MSWSAFQAPNANGSSIFAATKPRAMLIARTRYCVNARPRESRVNWCWRGAMGGRLGQRRSAPGGAAARAGPRMKTWTIPRLSPPPARAEFLPIAAPDIGARERELVLQALESGWITTGPRAFELAERVAALAGGRDALAVNSATGALHVALEALGVGEGDEVITTPYTFAATVNVIEHVRARPVLVDVEPDTLCIDPRRVEAALSPRTRVVLSVDYAGHPCDYDALRALTAPRGIRIVDDAAHALGAASHGRPVGSAALADITAFSLYATKNLTTGEGGAAVTDDAAIAERIRLLSLHGMSRDAWKRYGAGGSWFYEITAPGWKYNLSDLLAAIGVAQLERFEASQRRRHELVARYAAGLAGVPAVRLPVARPGMTHAWP